MRLVIRWTRLREIGLFLGLICVLTQPAFCNNENDPWQSLKQLKRGLGYVFIMRDMTCQYGQLKEVADTSVSIKTDRADVVVAKANLLRVRVGFGGRSVQNSNPNLALFTLYSGRSSWGDLLAFVPFESKEHPASAMHFLMTTQDGRAHRGILNQVTEDEIALADSFGKISSFSKRQVSRVDFITEKPLSETEEFHWDELAMLRIFDPQLYPRLFHLGDTMPVTLYQSAIPEDNSMIACR
jgi:hypothetical protein